MRSPSLQSEQGYAHFQFITMPRIDPMNSLAEQAVRFVVIDRHITQGTRSAKGQPLPSLVPVSVPA